MNDNFLSPETDKRNAISIWIIAIIIAHIVAYYNKYFGLDQLLPCIIAYIVIWGILIVLFTD